MPEKNGRYERPTIDEYGMRNAISAAERSSCLIRKVGAVVMLDKEIIGTGYNGAFRGFESCFKRGVCRKESYGLSDEEKNSGKCPAVHSEENAVQHALKNLGRFLHGATLYSLMYPCDFCAKTIANSGLSRVVYLLPYDEPNSQTEMFFRERNPPVEIVRLDSPELMEEYKTMLKRSGINPPKDLRNLLGFDWHFDYTLTIT